jgi:hypothetical protein
MSVVADFADLARLDADLGEAADRANRQIKVAVRTAVDKTATAAKGNVASFRTKSTGELLASIRVQHFDFAGRISADPKQAAMLEYGTPNTGAPRPWLSAPAGKAQEDLFAAVAEAGAPW